MNPQQVGRAGELFVAAEIHRRGGYAVTFAGNMPGIDVLASNLDDSRRISIQVKARQRGDFHAHFPRDASERPEDEDDTSFWIFVDVDAQPVYYIARRSWALHDVWKVHMPYLQQYREQHGKERESGHHKITTKRIAQWRDRWDLLGILAEEV